MKTRASKDAKEQDSAAISSPERRKFLGSLGGLTAAAVAGGAIGIEPTLTGVSAWAEAAEIGPLQAEQRRNSAYQVRHQAALIQKNIPLPSHPDNGDESLYPNKIASYSKALPHNGLGEPDLSAYNLMLTALASGQGSDFEAIPLGGKVKFTNPQCSYAFEMAGPDSHHLTMIAPPTFSSAWEAGEMAEVYWGAITRDVPFAQYSSSPLIAAAAADMSAFSDFRGPKVAGSVTPSTLFRGNTPGDVVGPYVSQFLLKPIPFGATTVVQQYRTAVPGNDFMTSYADWLNIQNGVPAAVGNSIDPMTRYIRNGRDLGEWLHRDFLYQGYMDACLILLGFGPAALEPANPYLTSATQVGFFTFGGAHILDFVARAARAAAEAAWYQKWLVHRRLRPEEFGGRVHNHVTGAAKYPIHPELLHSAAVSQVFSTFGSYLLPMAYPEGCPPFSAYPEGHGCVAGACVTMLKAFFNESFVIPGPVEASADGLVLVPYTGPALTVGGELNKLAANVAIGRDTAGVHWRTDGIEGMNLGEAVAIGIIQDYSTTYNEAFQGFSLTKFDGTTVTI
jgi:hypothetical protein